MPKSRTADVALRGLWVFTAFTLLGYATFGVNPSLVARFPSLAGFYGVAFRFFAVAHVWLAFLVLALFLSVYLGARWLPLFGAVYLLSLTSELLGTNLGVPFGHYSYTSLMDPAWFGHVPIVIPLSWFYMALPAYAIARALGRGGETGVAQVAVGAAVLTAWDLSLDPAMSFATPYWTWESAGPYYGMPWVNLVGWYATGLVLMVAIRALGGDRLVAAVPVSWLVSFYLANLVLPLGMNAASGLWWAVAAGIGTLGLGGWLMHRRLRAGLPADRQGRGLASSVGGGL